MTVVEGLLEVQGLAIEFRSGSTLTHAVRGLGYSIARGETLGIVGESGAGKSASALALVGLLPPTARVTAGSAVFRGQELLGRTERELQAIRGNQIGVVFQDPISNLNPVMTVGNQIAEMLWLKQGKRRTAARRTAAELLASVGIPNAAKRADDYPHQFSGGMCQRVMIAMALACDPVLLIADEPVTALDVTTQAQILDLLRRLQEERSMSILLITHNLGVVAGLADRVAVMYAGRIVETATSDVLLSRPRHPYTVGLLRSIPRLDGDRARALSAIEGAPTGSVESAGCPFRPRCPISIDRCVHEEPPLLNVGGGSRAACWVAADGHEQHKTIHLIAAPRGYEASAIRSGAGAAPLLEVRDLLVWYPVRRSAFWEREGWVRAVDGVSFTIERGRTLGLVGESGSGKTTIGRAIVQIERPRAGQILLEGEDLSRFKTRELRRRRQRFQMVFQNPFASLNGRHRVEEIIAEPLAIQKTGSGRDRRLRVRELLELVGLDPEAADRYPREFSGGQRQRISIARALAGQPELVICDEPVSNLDVSIQAQIVNLLRELQIQFDLTYLFISHDLAVVRHVADTVAVMYLGTLVEHGRAEDLYRDPQHPYTAALLSAVPTPNATVERGRKRILLPGDVSSATNLPTGCRFHPRCWLREALGKPEICETEAPALASAPSSLEGHMAACHFSRELRHSAASAGLTKS